MPIKGFIDYFLNLLFFISPKSKSKKFTTIIKTESDLFYRTISYAGLMTNKILVAAIIGIALTLVTTGSAFAASSWQHVVSSSVTTKNDQTTTLSVTASDSIPRHTDVLGGFAWIYAGGPNTVFVAVTHNGVRDSLQNPDGWHAHNVQLDFGASPNTAACITGLSDANVGLSIQGNTLNVNARNSELTGAFIPGAATAFTIVPDSGCTVTGLGVNLS